MPKTTEQNNLIMYALLRSETEVTIIKDCAGTNVPLKLTSLADTKHRAATEKAYCSTNNLIGCPLPRD